MLMLLLNHLQPDELAFHLETNEHVSFRLFTELVESLRDVGERIGLPPFELAIVELSTGSIFARLKLLFSDSPVDSRVAFDLAQKTSAARSAHDAEMAELARRSTVAAEKQAAAAVAQTAIAEKGLRIQRRTLVVGTLGLGVAVAGLGVAWAEHVRSDDPNPAARATAELMKNGVSRVTYCTQITSESFTRQDIPTLTGPAENTPPPVRAAARLPHLANDVPGIIRHIDGHFWFFATPPNEHPDKARIVSSGGHKWVDGARYILSGTYGIDSDVVITVTRSAKID